MFHRCRRWITKASAKHSYYREVTSVNRWHIIVISPYCAQLLGQALIRVPVILPKCLAHYTILRPSIELVTASATTEATWTQEHIFQLSTAEMQCECTWLLVLVWSLFTTCNTELAPPRFLYWSRPKVVWESLVSSRRDFGRLKLRTIPIRRKSCHSLNASRYDKTLDLGETAHAYFKLESKAGNHFFFLRNWCSHGHTCAAGPVTSYKAQHWFCYDVIV